MIGKIQRVALREVWKHEALDLTKWLQDNLDVLSDALKFSLSNAEREQSAGDFSVDLVAEDEDGNVVVIENQLEKSDHAHLGKLITYVTAIGAKKAIWIVAEPRPEHVAAITWLNESSSAEFYVLKLEGIRINDSAPAPLLTLIVGPSEEGREVGEAKKELAERHDLREKFWAELLQLAKAKTKLHANISPGHYSYVSAGCGKRGLGFNYSIRRHEGSVYLYIDRGKGAEEENRQILGTLERSKEAIEKAFGEPLEWVQSEGTRACAISKNVKAGGYRDEARWPAVHDAMIDAMVRLERALKPHIAELDL